MELTGNPSPIVVVPARDEEARLPALFAALACQSWIREAGRALPVVLVLNNCRDRSRELVRLAAARHPMLALDPVEVEFPPMAAHAGSARRFGLERALAGIADPAGTVLLTTDADAEPSPDWVAASLAAIEAGADLVGGRIEGDPLEEARYGAGFLARSRTIAAHAAQVDYLGALIDPLPHDPWPRHRDHTGASLAVRADVYAAVGGLPDLAFREDLGFVSRVRAAGGRLSHPLTVSVRVSARLVGRAAGGMSDCLKEWLRAEAEGRPILVEDPAAVEARFLRRRALRDCALLGDPHRRAAARSLGIDGDALLDAAGRPLCATALVERFAPDEPDAPATVPIAEATLRLAALIAHRDTDTHAA